jgi:hypothetical protein
MMYVHHLTESARAELKGSAFVLPLLPERDLHPAPAPHAAKVEHDQHAAYVNKATCAICHVSNDKAQAPLSAGPTCDQECRATCCRNGGGEACVTACGCSEHCEQAPVQDAIVV